MLKASNHTSVLKTILTEYGFTEKGYFFVDDTLCWIDPNAKTSQTLFRTSKAGIKGILVRFKNDSSGGIWQIVVSFDGESYYVPYDGKPSKCKFKQHDLSDWDDY